MRRVMRLILSFLFIGSGLGGSAFAFSPDFHLGLESSFSREVVTPAVFPIMRAGLESSADDHGLDLELKFSLAHPIVHAVSSKNAYYQFPFQLAVGRKWINWSQLDENWGLGAFNPLDAWDRLRSKSLGLSGFFFAVENENVRIDLFASYLMLPEINPNVIIENHQFNFYHPQSVSAGPQTFELLNRPTPLGYNLLIPNLARILFRPSVSFAVDSKKTIDPFNAKISYGYLPLNYFPMALQASLAIPIDQIVVDLRPRLLSHHLFNTEVALEVNEETRGGFSMLIDQLVREDSIPADYTTATLGTTTYWSPWIKFKNFKLSHVLSYGGIGVDTGPYANSTHNIFSSRILYRNATQLQFSISDFTAKLLHEFSIDANWIAVDWKHQWCENLNVLIGVDILSAEKIVADSGGAEFLADLRALDRIRLGVNYVF